MNVAAGAPRRRWVAALALAIVFDASHAFACSGAGAGATIARNELLAHVCFGATAWLTVLAQLSRTIRAASTRTRILLLLPTALHPGWWLGARSGDCGYLVAMAAPIATLLAMLILGGTFVAGYARARAAGGPQGRATTRLAYAVLAVIGLSGLGYAAVRDDVLRAQRARIRTLQAATWLRERAQEYHGREGVCPSTASLVDEKEVDPDLRADGWDRDYEIECDAVDVRVRSLGSDGLRDTDDDLLFDKHSKRVY
jgi:hypothetical protein